MEKTIDIIMEETSQKIINTLNESGLPPYLLRYIMRDISSEVEDVAKAQLQSNIEKCNKSNSEEKEVVNNVEESTEKED